MEFYYTHNAESDTPIMLIDRHVGGWDDCYGFGVDGASFVRELLYLDSLGKKSIDVWINSIGGSVMEGMSIYNAILNTKTKVNTYNTGVCASIAAVIFQAGRHRSMADYSLQMLHNTSSDGGSMEVLSKFNQSVATMISSRCGKSVEDVLAIMDKTSWYSASESLMEGLCDEVTNSDAKNKKRVVAANDIVDNWRAAAEIMNSAITELKTVNKTSNMSNYAAIANTLGLNPEASGEAIAKEIQSLKNIAEVAKANLAAKDNEILNLTNTLASVRKETADTIAAKDAELAEGIKNKDAEILKIQNEVKADRDLLARMKVEQEEATKAAELATIKNMVAEYAKSGRIENKVESCAKWEAMAVAQGIETVKDLLEALPLNKKSNPIVITDISGATGMVTAAEMIANMRKARSKN